jgi:bacterioferritin
VTQDYEADRPALLRLLNRALAGELIAALRYRRDAIVATGILSRSAADEFRAHADQELGHADKLARRIVELRGVPDFAPDTLRERSYSEYQPVQSLGQMIHESLVAERAAVSFYRQVILWLDDRDPTTRSLLEGILAAEERHAEDMRELLMDRDGPSRPQDGRP